MCTLSNQRCKYERCQRLLTVEEVRVWGDRCQTCGKKTYKFVIGKLSQTIADLEVENKRLKREGRKG